ncbi:MAG: YsnF/AvaK domain-containing protein [Chloroflexi bacterium]|nr:YsnF/AvaK domain-containing protein [Chloroflexota bacterium]
MTSQERHILGQHGQHDGTVQREESDAVVQLREEELAARKQQVESGRVSLGTEVVEEEQTLEVPVTREEVTVERHPVDRRPSDEPIEASSEVLRVPVREDQVSVDKQSVVYEEVNVGKRAVQETQRVSDTVRKEVVDVDATGDVEVGREGNAPR